MIRTGDEHGPMPFGKDSARRPDHAWPGRVTKTRPAAEGQA